jgi:sugar/nucleoside kinase (ribokinase family)
MATDGIAFAGSIIVDNVKTVESWPERGMLSRILRTERSLGGLVPNTAIYLKTLDPSIPVSAIGCVGTDEPGKFALSTLSSHGIDVSRVRKIDCPTSFTDVMTLAKTGERTFFNMHGADSFLRPEDVVSPVAGASMVHLGYLLLLDSMDEEDDEYGTAAARLLARLKADGMKTSIDIVSENTPRFAKVVRPALKYCDYLIVNELEAGKLTQEFNANLSAGAEAEVLQQLIDEGCNVVDVTDKSVWADACAAIISKSAEAHPDLYQKLLDFAN